MEGQPAGESVAAVARGVYGRLVAWLACQWRDVAAAEDALATAFEKALRLWPIDGVPDAPEAWLLTVARRELLQAHRHDKVRDDPRVVALLDDEFAPEVQTEIPDNRLRLMFVCAHPAIDATIRAPMMLQTVLGLQAEEIAAAMLLAPKTLAQRLVRAKQKIRDNGVRFEEPELSEMPDRMAAVLEAIYGAYGMAWDTGAGEHRVSGLRQETLYLAELAWSLQPDSAEAAGLLALMRFCEARRPAQLDAAGQFVPLAQQEVQRWDRNTLISADRLLMVAARLRRPGPFQLEAAIQSAHCQRAFTGVTPWVAICQLYKQLVDHFPSIGATVAYAVALGESDQLVLALEILEGIEPERSRLYQPWWVARGELLYRAEQREKATEAMETAIGMTMQPVLRTYLRRRVDLMHAE